MMEPSFFIETSLRGSVDRGCPPDHQAPRPFPPQQFVSPYELCH